MSLVAAKVKATVSTALAATALVLSSSAGAALISYTNTQTIGSTLGNGASYGNTFNLSSVIRPGYDYKDINASLKFVFADDGDAVSSGSSTGAYAYAGSNTLYTGGDYSNYWSYKTYQDQSSYYDRTVTSTFSDAAESVSVNAEGVLGSASSQYYSSGAWTAQDQVTSSVYTGTSSAAYWWGQGYDYTYTANYNVYRDDRYASTSGYGGADTPFLLTMAVDPLSVLDGLLAYSLQVSGDLILKSVTLSLNGTESLHVPEPLSLALVLTGLLGLGAARRRAA